MSTTDTRELVSNVKVGIDLEELLRQARDIQSNCVDYSVSNASIKNMRYDGDTCRLLYQPDDTSVASRKKSMTRHSLGQLCSKIGVPVRYIDKCIDSGRLDLAEDNINSWLEDFGKNLFIREHANTVRGVLSDRYSVLDTPDILEVLNDTIDFNEYKINGYFINPERFHARIIQREMMNIDGEDLFAGLQVDSSDVGRSILIVKFFIFKQVCTNGLVLSQGGGVLFQQKHIGISVADFRSEFTSSISTIPTLMENAKELIAEARKDSKGYHTPSFNEQQMKDFVERMKFKTRLSDEGVNKVIEFMTEKYSHSKWGLVNSITEVAQDYTLERRLELEKIAGELLAA